MKRHFLLLAASLAATSLFSVSTATAAGRVEFRNLYTVPISETVQTCSGETVELTGVLEHRVVIVVDPNGGLHLSVTNRGIEEGTSESGTRYVGTFTDVGAEYIPLDEAPGTGTFPFSFRLVSNDGSPNLLVRGFFHITVNANGEVTNFSQDFEVVCH